MADKPVSTQARFQQRTREVLGNAYGFVRSCQFTRTFANLTYEELLDAAIGRIEGDSSRSEVRSTKLERIAQIKDTIVKTVVEAKKLPPAYWVFTANDEDNANTTEEQED